MADSKYGRLFTERDVAELVQAADERGFERGSRSGYETDYDGNPPSLLDLLADSRPRLTFSPDEPLFLLRGQDRFAPDGVMAYWEALNDAEDGEGGWLVSERHRDAVADAGNALDHWQAEHPDRVKVPD